MLIGRLWATVGLHRTQHICWYIVSACLAYQRLEDEGNVLVRVFARRSVTCFKMIRCEDTRRCSTRVKTQDRGCLTNARPGAGSARPLRRGHALGPRPWVQTPFQRAAHIHQPSGPAQGHCWGAQQRGKKLCYAPGGRHDVIGGRSEAHNEGVQQCDELRH